MDEGGVEVDEFDPLGGVPSFPPTRSSGGRTTFSLLPIYRVLLSCRGSAPPGSSARRPPGEIHLPSILPGSLLSFYTRGEDTLPPPHPPRIYLSPFSGNSGPPADGPPPARTPPPTLANASPPPPPASRGLRAPHPPLTPIPSPPPTRTHFHPPFFGPAPKKSKFRTKLRAKSPRPYRPDS